MTRKYREKDLQKFLKIKSSLKISKRVIVVFNTIYAALTKNRQNDE